MALVELRCWKHSAERCHEMTDIDAHVVRAFFRRIQTVPAADQMRQQEDGGRFAALVPPGATVLDGELLLPVDGEGAYRTIPLPAEWNGNIRAYTASRLEDEADLVDPDTPLDEFCPGWNSWMVFGRNVPPRAG